MNYKQLTFAREYRGYSQTELAKSILGLSQSNLSKFEKGLETLSDDVQEKIIDFLDFPKEFFNRKINFTIDNANYRKKSTISKAMIQQFENKCKIIGYIVDELSEVVEWPSFTLSPLNVEGGYSPKQIAHYNRKLLKLRDDEPVKNIFSLLEESGIIIYEIDENEKFDGLSFVSNNGFPVIIINKKFDNDRKRLTLAHELGHLLLHNENLFPVSSFRDKEAEAFEFAGEFLMPESAIKNSLYRLRLNDLGMLKKYWLTSKSSIITRAKNLKCIDQKRYTYFMIEMSRSGELKKEDIEVYIDNPTCLKNAYYLLKNELSYSIEDFVNFTALPEDIIEDILIPDKLVKLKIINRN